MRPIGTGVGADREPVPVVRARLEAGGIHVHGVAERRFGDGDTGRHERLEGLVGRDLPHHLDVIAGHATASVVGQRLRSEAGPEDDAIGERVTRRHPERERVGHQIGHRARGGNRHRGRCRRGARPVITVGRAPHGEGRRGRRRTGQELPPPDRVRPSRFTVRFPLVHVRESDTTTARVVDGATGGRPTPTIGPGAATRTAARPDQPAGSCLDAPPRPSPRRRPGRPASDPAARVGRRRARRGCSACWPRAPRVRPRPPPPAVVDHDHLGGRTHHHHRSRAHDHHRGRQRLPHRGGLRGARGRGRGGGRTGRATPVARRQRR